MSGNYLTYEFGCLPPSRGSEAALDQMLRRNRLWNVLVEVERRHRLEQAAVPGNKARLASLEVLRRSSVKVAQSESGLYWCNYDAVINSYERARKRLSRNDGLRSRRWTGSGRVTVRFQHGLPVPDAFAADTRLQIDPVDPLAWASPERGVRRRLARSRVRIRVGSDRRTPVWLELPAVLHRPLPEGGAIRAASVFREAVGGRYRWRLLITVKQPDPTKRAGPAVGVTFVWRSLPQGLRVAVWEDEVGRSGELILDSDLLWEFTKLNELRSNRDHSSNMVRQTLAGWAGRNPLPEWIDLSGIEKWRGAGALLRLHGTWSARRFEGDDDAFAALSSWKRRHLHLTAWEENLRDQVLRRRNQVYREFVAGLVHAHGAMFLEDLDLRALARASKPNRDEGDRLRVVASPSTLGRYLDEKGGCTRLAVPEPHQQCSWCGHTNVGPGSVDATLLCPACGRQFDRDRNAARNILHQGMACVA